MRIAATLLLALTLLGGAACRGTAMTIERVTGASGIEAWLVRDNSIPIVTLRFALAGGSNLDRAGKEGTAAMTAALLDEGAGPYDGVAYRERLDELAGELSFSAGRDEFNGTLRMLKANLSDTLELLRIALAEPHFASEPIERVRGETLAMLARQARNPRSLASRLWMREAFEHHPYGNDTSGSPASVAALTRDDIAGYAAKQFRRSGLVIGVVGDITTTELAAAIDKVFGGLPPGDGGGGLLPDTAPDDAGALIVSRAAIPQSAVMFGQVGIKRDDPDWYAAMALNDVLGGSGFRGRLMQEIREKRGLAYGVSTDLVPYRHTGLILGSVSTENARVAESIELIRQEWRRMRDEGPTEAELRDAQTYLIASFPLSLDSTRRIAGLLVRMQTDRLGIDYLDRRAGLIGGVTLDRARAVAKRLYDPAKLSFTVVGDPAGLAASRPARQPVN